MSEAGVRILAGGPTRETTSACFRLHMEGLGAQQSFAFDLNVHHEIVPDDSGPRWHHDKIERVAKRRQWFMTNASEGYDALFMVDSDVILGPGVLERLWAVDADVVYGVFWTEADWGRAPGVKHWPQVWSHHPYRFDEETWAALCEPGINEIRVRGGGACTLIRGRGFESRYFPLLESLSAYTDMMSGEDRSYCLGLECRDIRQVAVTGLPIVHLYTEAQRTPEACERAAELVGLRVTA